MARPIAGENDLRAFAQGEVGNGEGDAGRREDARHQDLLSLEDHPGRIVAASLN